MEVLEDAGTAFERIYPAVVPPPGTGSYREKADKLHLRVCIQPFCSLTLMSSPGESLNLFMHSRAGGP